MLKDGRVASRLPVRDLEKARAFYAEKLGLEPAEERPGGLLYTCGGTEFALFESQGTASGTHTQMGWTVDDIEAPGRARGLVQGPRRQPHGRGRDRPLTRRASY